ncbi:flavodoxin family protein [Candidatus Leptofilum sp.]|uniref:flavodoxin family protein n=1 Tax=Candidatus Leptofilum sp. TaxID=3241576 RepID=UPI003B5BA28A
MNIAIVYDSSTGTTAKAAEKMGKEMEAHGHQCRVQSISLADPADVSEADLICIGSWVKGLFIIRQHPTEGTMRFIEQLGDLSGKKVMVFCTYKLAVGSTLCQMAKALEKKGAKVVGQYKYRDPEPSSKFASFANSLT